MPTAYPKLPRPRAARDDGRVEPPAPVPVLPKFIAVVDDDVNVRDSKAQLVFESQLAMVPRFMSPVVSRVKALPSVAAAKVKPS